MKKYLLLILLFIFKWHLRIIYFFIKLFTKQKKQVFFLSRQFDEIPLNYQMLIDELKKEVLAYKELASAIKNEHSNEIEILEKKYKKEGK